MDKISAFISGGEYEKAAEALSIVLEKEGFNDTLAVYAATINSAFGDTNGTLSMIQKGLEFNPDNYELHLMYGDFLSSENLIDAFNEYEWARALSYTFAGADSEDYEYIKKVYETFVSENKDEICAYKKSLPVLIYKSEETCYGVLNFFADNLAEALKGMGIEVIIRDTLATKETSLHELFGQRFRAIIGIQTYLFAIRLKDGKNVHNFIFGTKTNVIFDHPTCMHNHLINAPLDHMVLTHDRCYEAFLKEYYKETKVSILPPGGCVYEGEYTPEKYGLSFVGSFLDPKGWEPALKELDDKYKGKAKELVSFMMETPNIPYEKAVCEVFQGEISREDIFNLKQTYFFVMSEYRKKILLTILNSGIRLHVFGKSFDNEVFMGFTNLIKHDELSPKESLKVYKESKVSLNIMSWHKDGRTERVANAMLNRSLVLSDRCDYLCENFTEGKEIALFDLKEIERLPDIIKSLLSLSKEEVSKRTEDAFIKASKMDSWEKRAKELIDLLD